MSYRPRVIPILQLSGKGLVKTLRFSEPVYVGDPINAVRIFNDQSADELVLMDIDASKKNQPIQFELVRRIAEEAYMPMSYGGGIKTLEDATKLIKSGVEKIILGTAAFENPQLITEISDRFGAQAVMVCCDVKKTSQEYKAFYCSATRTTSGDVMALLQNMIKLGAGEILLQFIDTDGTQSGVDSTFVQSVAQKIDVPVIVAGGVSSLMEIKKLTLEMGASAVAAGSMFTFLGSRNSVMINYPEQDEFADTFS